MMSYPNGGVPAARPRPRPQKPKTPEATRDSGAVRASVLDAALQLGLGANPAVADWMFSNTLQEEDEDHTSSNPGLTHSEESPASSPQSGRYPLTPSSPSSQNHSTNLNHNINNFNVNFSNFHFQHANTAPLATSSDSNPLIPHITNAENAPPRPTTPSKLKKKRNPNKDDYESDAGFLSDAKRKKDKKKDKKQKDKSKDAGSIPPVPTLSVPLPGSSNSSFLMIPDGVSETGVETGEARRRAQSLVKATSKSKSAPTSPMEQMGYETDGGRKSKKKWGKKSSAEDDADLKKSRSLFFRLRNKGSKGDLTKQNSLEATGEKPPALPLPIAERFATTLNKQTGAPMIALEGPSGSGSSQLGIDIGLGLSSDMFSASPPKQSESLAPPSMTSLSLTAATHSPKPTSPAPSSYSTQLQISTSSPPVSFPSSPLPNDRPSSSGTTTSIRTSTSTNTHSHSTTAARTSLATSISTSQSHSHFINSSGMPLNGVLSRESSNNDVPGMLPGSTTFPQTPSKRRVLPFLGTPRRRGSISSGDGLEKEKEKEKKREDKERKKEKEKLKEETTGKKQNISLPLTRAGSNDASGAPEVVITPSNPTSPLRPLITPGTSHRPNADNAAADASPLGSIRPQSPTHPPVSHQPFRVGGLSKQISTPTLRIDRPASPMNGRASPIPLSYPASGRTSPMPRGKGLGSPPSSRYSPLPGPPNVLAYYDVPPPTPPPLSPLPSVPGAGTPGSSTPNGNLSVNVGIAVTTGSPLPSPLLVTSPHYNGSSPIKVSPTGGAKPNGAVAPPTSFSNPLSAAANALRAKVQRRLSQSDGFPTPNSNGASTSEASNIPTVSVTRGTSIRGRESPFPVLPLSTHKGGLSVSNNTALPPRAKSPRLGWDNDEVDRYGQNDGYNNGDDDDEMEDVRGVLARFRESRIDDGVGQEIEYREAAEGVIATRRSFEALQGNGGPAMSGASTDASVSPLPSSGLGVPVNGERSSGVSGSGSGSGRYDSFLIEEYYGHGRENGNDAGLFVPSSVKPYGEDGDLYADDDDLEDASYYPDDEIHPNRRSRRRRSTLYLSDEEHDTSSNSGHGHGGKSSRNNRWSGSIYSRASFLDTEKSGEARQRFLRHVEEMLDERGERIPAVPPVPKLPEEFVAESRRAAAAARQEYEEYVVKRTIGVGARKAPAGSGLGR